jgi:hypothetical protein
MFSEPKQSRGSTSPTAGQIPLQCPLEPVLLLTVSTSHKTRIRSCSRKVQNLIISKRMTAHQLYWLQKAGKRKVQRCAALQQLSILVINNVSSVASPAHAPQKVGSPSLLRYTPAPSPTAQSQNVHCQLQAGRLHLRSKDTPAPVPTAAAQNDHLLLLLCMS